MKRIFLIVLDSCGVGAMPDSEKFGDVGVNTLRSCTRSEKLHIPNLIAAGLGNLDGVDYLPKASAPTGAIARLAEASMGKDTTIGHWEIAGLISPDPLPTYPDGFPDEVLEHYRTVGGSVHLEYVFGGAYSIFGQVFEGLETVDEIAAAETDETDKPLEDIIIHNITFETYTAQ